jgi:hypothetical protein
MIEFVTPAEPFKACGEIMVILQKRARMLEEFAHLKEKARTSSNLVRGLVAWPAMEVLQEEWHSTLVEILDVKNQVEIPGGLWERLIGAEFDRQEENEMARYQIWDTFDVPLDLISFPPTLP